MPTLNIKSTQQAIKVGEHKGEEMFVMRVEHYNTMDAERIIDYAAETRVITLDPASLKYNLANCTPGFSYYYKVEADGTQLTSGRFQRYSHF